MIMVAERKGVSRLGI